jgi:hypothetical protein
MDTVSPERRSEIMRAIRGKTRPKCCCGVSFSAWGIGIDFTEAIYLARPTWCLSLGARSSSCMVAFGIIIIAGPDVIQKLALNIGPFVSRKTESETQEAFANCVDWVGQC